MSDEIGGQIPSWKAPNLRESVPSSTGVAIEDPPNLRVSQQSIFADPNSFPLKSW